MPAAYDILIDPTDEDVDIDTDIKIGLSDKQHIADIIGGVPGWIKEFPLAGWNPYLHINARTNPQEIRKTITIQLQADGFFVNSVPVTLDSNGQLVIGPPDAYRP